MAVSNSSNYSVDRDTLIRMAYENIGVAVEGEPLQPEQITRAARKLNVKIKFLVTKGFRLWKRSRRSITLVASQNTYTMSQKAAGTTTSTTASKLVDSGANFVADVAVGDTVNNTTDSTSTTISAIDSTTQLSIADDIFTSGEDYEITTSNVSFPRPDRILDCSRKDSSGNESTITPLSLEEYENLPNKTTTGTPVQYFYDPELTEGKIYVWPSPNSTAATDYTMEIVALTQVFDMDSATDTFDFPQYWYQPLIDLLTYELAKSEGGIRIGELQMLKMDAESSLDDAVSFDQGDTSVYFQPNMERG